MGRSIPTRSNRGNLRRNAQGQNFQSSLTVLALLTCVSFAVSAATPATATAPDELPLDVYQKLKGDLDALYGARATLVSGLQARSRPEVESDLRADASANKDVLLRALRSASALKRELAVVALEYCGDKKSVVAALQPLLNGDSDASVRRAAAAVLARLPDAAAAEALIKALTDSEDAVRGLSATALGNLHDPRASNALLRVLSDDSNPIVRLQAAMALSKIKDENALKALKTALDAEQDERVKMAIAGAVRATLGGDDAKTGQIPTAEETTNELVQLAHEMKDVETKLREDRYDRAVQSQGNGIEEKLSALIVKLDKECNCQCQQKPGEKKQPQPQTGQLASSTKRPSSPMKDSQLSSYVPPGPTVEAFVTGTQDKWSKLPPAERDAMLQAFREEYPAQWKKRLEAYFTSIAAQEAYGK